MNRLRSSGVFLFVALMAGCAGDADTSRTPDELANGAPPPGTDPDGDGLVNPVPDADLPYDVKMVLGQTYRPVIDAFVEKGGLPAALVDVEMDGGGDGWLLEEVRAAVPITITQADCDHEGNRDVGRDRVNVTWRNTDGSEETDHLDLRYCDAE